MTTRILWAVALCLVATASPARAGQDAADTAAGDPGDAADSVTHEPPGPKAVPEILPAAARFVIVELHEEVSLGMAALVDRVARDLQPGDVLVLDINTFGGRVDAAVRMRDTLLDLGQQNISTIAYVHPRAISAGALISLATDVIAVAPGATIGAATPVRMSGGKAEPVEEKTVSYMRKEMRATAEARGRDGDIAEAMVDADVEVPGLVPAGKLLTLDGKAALEWGVASLEAATLEALVDALGYGPNDHSVHPVSWSWAERVAAFLTGSMMSGLLMSIGMLGLMIGLYTGGNPVPLAAGAICLALFFFGHNVVALAGLEEILLFVLGLGLIVVEVLVPGYFVFGILGGLLVVGSLLLGLVSFEQVPLEVQWQEGWLVRALGTVFGAVAGAGVLSVVVFQVLPGTRLGRTLLLEAALQGRATDSSEQHNQGVVGQEGVAESDLRPSGKVKIGRRRYDAVAEHGFVPRGDRVRVKKIRGFSVVVAPVARAGDDGDGADPSPTSDQELS